MSTVCYATKCVHYATAATFSFVFFFFGTIESFLLGAIPEKQYYHQEKGQQGTSCAWRTFALLEWLNQHPGTCSVQAIFFCDEGELGAIPAVIPVP